MEINIHPKHKSNKKWSKVNNTEKRDLLDRILRKRETLPQFSRDTQPLDKTISTLMRELDITKPKGDELVVDEFYLDDGYGNRVKNFNFRITCSAVLNGKEFIQYSKEYGLDDTLPNDFPNIGQEKWDELEKYSEIIVKRPFDFSKYCYEKLLITKTF
jgi:hypothetical protein